MKRSILYFSGMLLLTFAAGCSSNVAPPATSPQVNYVKDSTYLYTQQSLDTADRPVGQVDTITSTIVATDTTYFGMSNVTVIQNRHSSGAAMDTTYIAQESGDYWHYNYGLESANTNAVVLGYNNNKPLNAGWVLQAKLGAAEGEKWQAANTPVTVGSLTPTLIDTATEASDANVNVEGSSINAKHAVHAINLTTIGASVIGTVDTYVSASDGMVQNIVHAARVTLGTSTIWASGTETILIKAP